MLAYYKMETYVNSLRGLDPDKEPCFTNKRREGQFTVYDV